MPTLARLVLPLALALAACAPSPEQSRLDTTYGFTVRMLSDVARNPIAAASYGSTIEGGGTPVTYVIVGAPDHADFTDIVWQGPAAPWTVVIKDGPGASDLVVEAYAGDATKPAQTETVDLAFKR